MADGFCYLGEKEQTWKPVENNAGCDGIFDGGYCLNVEEGNLKSLVCSGALPQVTLDDDGFLTAPTISGDGYTYPFVRRTNMAVKDAECYSVVGNSPSSKVPGWSSNSSKKQEGFFDSCTNIPGHRDIAGIVFKGESVIGKSLYIDAEVTETMLWDDVCTVPCYLDSGGGMMDKAEIVENIFSTQWTLLIKKKTGSWSNSVCYDVTLESEDIRLEGATVLGNQHRIKSKDTYTELSGTSVKTVEIKKPIKRIIKDSCVVFMQDFLVDTFEIFESKIKIDLEGSNHLQLYNLVVKGCEFGNLEIYGSTGDHFELHNVSMLNASYKSYFALNPATRVYGQKLKLVFGFSQKTTFSHNLLITANGTGTGIETELEIYITDCTFSPSIHYAVTVQVETGEDTGIGSPLAFEGVNFSYGQDEEDWDPRIVHITYYPAEDDYPEHVAVGIGVNNTAGYKKDLAKYNITSNALKELPTQNITQNVSGGGTSLTDFRSDLGSSFGKLFLSAYGGVSNGAKKLAFADNKSGDSNLDGSGPVCVIGDI